MPARSAKGEDMRDMREGDEMRRPREIRRAGKIARFWAQTLPLFLMIMKSLRAFWEKHNDWWLYNSKFAIGLHFSRLSVVCLVLFSAGGAWGSDMCVRTTGVCTAFSQTCAACYTTIALANTASSEGDRIILWPETHAAPDGQVLKTDIYNAREDGDYSDTIIELADSEFTVALATDDEITWKGITIQGLNAGSTVSAFRVNDDNITLNLDHVQCKDNINTGVSTSGGGCMKVAVGKTGNTINWIDSLITGNQSYRQGGAIYISSSNAITFTRTTCSGNTDNDTGVANGGGCLFGNGGTTVTATGSTFSDNHTEGSGGAVYLNNNSSFSFTNTDFTDNTCDTSAAAMYAIVDGEVSITGGTVSGNTTNMDEDETYTDGAIAIRDASNGGTSFTATISNVTFSENSSALVVAGNHDGGGLTISGLDATGDVGAFTITGCTFSENYADQGGGFYSGQYATGTVSNTKFLNNKSLRAGGGSFRGGELADNAGELTTYKYCEFIGNKAGVNEDGTASSGIAGTGGGIQVLTYPKITLYNCTFLGNSVAATGTGTPMGSAIFNSDEDVSGGCPAGDGQSTAVNNLIYGNTGATYEVHTIDASGGECWASFDTNAYVADAFLGAQTTASNTITIAALPTLSLTSAVLQESSALINAGAVITGLHDQAAPATDVTGQSVLTVPDVGAHEYTNGIWLKAGATGGNGTRANPYGAWTDYTWTGYNLRTGATVYYEGDMGSLDLSGLTDDNPVLTIGPAPGKTGTVTGFVGDGDNSKLQSRWGWTIMQ